MSRDTVASVGVGRKPLPETTSGMTHVCVFRHALALDELRVKYLPEYVHGGAGPSYGGDVKEVWFAGSHSDVCVPCCLLTVTPFIDHYNIFSGGGNVPNVYLNNFGPALRWMAYEALSHGLKMDYRAKSPKILSKPKPSMTWGWRMLEIPPIQRLVYEDQDSTTRRQVILSSLCPYPTEALFPAHICKNLASCSQVKKFINPSYASINIMIFRRRACIQRSRV